MEIAIELAEALDELVAAVRVIHGEKQDPEAFLEARMKAQRLLETYEVQTLLVFSDRKYLFEKEK